MKEYDRISKLLSLVLRHDPKSFMKLLVDNSDIYLTDFDYHGDKTNQAQSAFLM